MHLRDISLPQNRCSINMSSLDIPTLSLAQSTPSALVGNLGAPLDLDFLRESPNDEESELDNEKGGAKTEIAGVSNDPLTTGLVLDFMRD